MKSRDPLGIQKAIDNKLEMQKRNPIDRDQYESWLNNPVTKRLLEDCAYAVYSGTLQHGSLNKDQEKIVDMVINWKPEELQEVGNDE